MTFAKSTQEITCASGAIAAGAIASTFHLDNVEVQGTGLGALRKRKSGASSIA
jgi:hypothetical protein